MTAPIKLVVGLGNPGAKYRGTRHNAGADFVTALAGDCGIELSPEGKFSGLTGRGLFHGFDLRLLVPTTFMNLSGQAVAPMAGFYGLAPENLLIAHDELDVAPGSARFKFDGGHGGHNGLRDIIPALGNRADFHRLRIGIGHPGSAKKVSGYVLSRPAADDAQRIADAIAAAIDALPLLLAGEPVKAMTRLHSVSAE